MSVFPAQQSIRALTCAAFVTFVALSRADEPEENAVDSPADQAATKAGPQCVPDLTIGPRKLVRPRDKMPFVVDTSLATLRKDQATWFFYHTVDWGKRIDKYSGTVLETFQTKVWQKNRDELFDLNGWYADIHHAGLWLNNIYQIDDRRLLGVVHVELHHQTPQVNHGEEYAIGVVHSSDAGEHWTYCGEIVRPKNPHGNIGGTPISTSVP